MSIIKRIEITVLSRGWIRIDYLGGTAGRALNRRHVPHGSGRLDEQMGGIRAPSSAQELPPPQGEARLDGEEGERSVGFGPSSSSWRDRDEEAEMYTLIGRKISALRQASREREREEKAKKSVGCAGGRRRTLFFFFGGGGVLFR